MEHLLQALEQATALCVAQGSTTRALGSQRAPLVCLGPTPISPASVYASFAFVVPMLLWQVLQSAHCARWASTPLVVMLPPVHPVPLAPTASALGSARVHHVWQAHTPQVLQPPALRAMWASMSLPAALLRVCPVQLAPTPIAQGSACVHYVWQAHTPQVRQPPALRAMWASMSLPATLLRVFPVLLEATAPHRGGVAAWCVVWALTPLPLPVPVSTALLEATAAARAVRCAHCALLARIPPPQLPQPTAAACSAALVASQVPPTKQCVSTVQLECTPLPWESPAVWRVQRACMQQHLLPAPLMAPALHVMLASMALPLGLLAACCALQASTSLPLEAQSVSAVRLATTVQVLAPVRVQAAVQVLTPLQ